jgi:diguanylate cyclase (GGDEF)-like protein
MDGVVPAVVRRWRVLSTKRSFKKIKQFVLVPLSILFLAASLIWAASRDSRPWYLWVSVAMLVFLILHYFAEKRDHTAESRRQKLTEERIRHLVYYDDLTGLPNRRQFRERLAKQLALPETATDGLAVFYLDIDQFQLVNESLGHDYGDILLLQAAERLSQIVGPQDLIARMDGDQFAFYFARVGTEEAAYAKAERIMELLKDPFQLQDYRIHATASIGIALSERDSLRAEDLIRGADVAMARAKEHGRNTYMLFTHSMSRRTMERLKLEQEMREALANGQFTLYYQPQINVVDGKLIGFEALLRWVHPELGLISPGRFIPIAEENGMIDAIGEWVIREACRQNKAWLDAGFEIVPISVNLSTKQFRQHGLGDKIRSILQETGLDPQYLGLEITESVMMNIEQASQCLTEMKRLGVHISIDDFGTGYSSLGYLKQLPVDRLKIDRSFVRDVLKDPNDAAIVGMIIAMAHHLNLKVIAEGVETEEQKNYLLAHFCTEVQGYLYGPPMHASAVEETWRNRVYWTEAGEDAG